MKQFRAIFVARTMEFVRDRGTFFWNLFFPVLLVIGFGFVFSGQGQALFTVGVLAPRESVPEIPLLAMAQVEVIAWDDAEQAEAGGTDAFIEQVRRHQLDMLIDPESGAYWVNDASAGGPVVRMLLETDANRTALAASGIALTEQRVTGDPVRYVDWVVPGVIGMNMMFSSLFGVGFVLVRYRKNGVLKRLKATPVSAFTFVTAQAASRLIIVVTTSVIVFTATNLIFGFMMNGSWALLLLITTLGIICMIAIGLVFASRLRSEELTSGLMNLVTLPMLALSGVFFSLESAPGYVQRVSRVFPLTHFTEAARAIMIDGAGIAEVGGNVLMLALIAGVSLVLAAGLFRWE